MHFYVSPTTLLKIMYKTNFQKYQIVQILLGDVAHQSSKHLNSEF